MAIIRLQGAQDAALGVYYEIDSTQEPIGKGGMGIVYRGVRVEKSGVRRDAAVKFLYDDLPANAINRAYREASIQIRNENLIEMFGFIEVNDQGPNGTVVSHYHVASELLDGIMLYDLLDGNLTDKNGEEPQVVVDLYKKMTEDRPHFALYIIKNVLSGLIALHDAGYVHRDIDPSNVMITRDGKVKLIDFGIAKNLKEKSDDAHLTKSGQYMGKPAFSAPELALGDVAHQNPTTDLYAVGIMLFQLVTGHLPFIGSDAEVLNNQIRGKMPLNEIAERPIRKIIEKATSKKQNERYTSASEFRVAIEQIEKKDFSKSVTLSERITHTATDAISTSAKSKKPIFIVAAVVVIVAVISLLFVSNQKKEKEMQIIEQQEQEIAALKNALSDSIADDSSLSPIYNEIADMNVNTIGMLMAQAKETLSTDAAKGISQLKRIANLKYRNCSSEAAYILGRLHYSKNLPDDLAVVKANSNISDDLSLMAYYDSLAVDIDPNNYKALYERSADLTLPDMERGAVQNQPLALEYASKAANIAVRQGDYAFAEKANKLVSRLKANDNL